MGKYSKGGWPAYFKTVEDNTTRLEFIECIFSANIFSRNLFVSSSDVNTEKK